MADTSPTSTRLITLLFKIRDGLGQSLDSLRQQFSREAMREWPTIEAEGKLPTIEVDDDDVNTAVLYLRDVGLKYDGLRLHGAFAKLRNRCMDEWFASMADGESQEYRDKLTELFGPFPSQGNPSDSVVADRRVAIVGWVGQLSEFVDELISSVTALSETQPDASDDNGQPPAAKPVEDDDSPPEQKVTRQEYERLLEIKKKIDPENTYIGQSVAILKVFAKIELFNTHPLSDKPVLIRGQTGAGKNHIAKLIHNSSGRRNSEYREEHSATLRANDWGFIHTRLAGCVRGHGIAGVDEQGQKGLLEECDGGSLLIDELARVSFDMQTFLLLVLERKPISKAGSKPGQFQANVRLLFATNADLEKLINDDEFPDDLYHRVKGQTLWIPPLAARREDIPLFVRKWCDKTEVKNDFYLALLEHDWSGNVRDLESVVNSAIAHANSDGRPLSADMLDLREARELLQKDPATIDQQLCDRLAKILREQGFEKGKKGMALHKRIADILGWREPRVSEVLG